MAPQCIFQISVVMVNLMDIFAPICVRGLYRLIAARILEIWVLWFSALGPRIESISLRLYIDYALMRVSTILLSLDVFVAQLNLWYSIHKRAYLTRAVSFILYYNDYKTIIIYLYSFSILGCFHVKLEAYIEVLGISPYAFGIFET